MEMGAQLILFPTFCGESYELRFAIRTFPVIVQSTIISQHMVPFSWELKSQQRSEKIWALHTVNIRTIRPENIIQMHEKINTIYGKKSAVHGHWTHHSTVQLNMRLSPLGYWACNWSCLFFYSHGYASYEKGEKVKLKYENFQVYAMLNYHTNIL